MRRYLSGGVVDRALLTAGVINQHCLSARLEMEPNSVLKLVVEYAVTADLLAKLGVAFTQAATEHATEAQALDEKGAGE